MTFRQKGVEVRSLCCPTQQKRLSPRARVSLRCRKPMQKNNKKIDFFSEIFLGFTTFIYLQRFTTKIIYMNLIGILF